jgi:hypothetical protein
LKYFGHDCDAGDYSKLSMVVIKYTILGYGVYFRCNELIGRTISRHCTECVLQENLAVLEHKFQIPQEKIEEILEYFVEIDLFDKTEDGKYRNLKLLTRLDEYTKKYVHTESRQYTDNVQNKEKKRNENKRKEITPTAGAVNFENLTSKEFAVKELFEKTYKEVTGHDIDFDNVTNIDREIDAIKAFAEYSPELLHEMIVRGLSNKLEKIKHSCTTLSGVWLNRNYLKLNDETSGFKGSGKPLSSKKVVYEKLTQKIQMV